eukprot:1201284-Prymnesium_polylepis.1
MNEAWCGFNLVAEVVSLGCLNFASAATATRHPAPEPPTALAAAARFRAHWTLDVSAQMICLLYTSPSPRDAHES